MYKILPALFFIVTNAMATSSQDCPSMGVSEFMNGQEYGSLEFGYFSDLDHTQNSQCVEAEADCGMHQLYDPGYAGYYDPHTVYYITYGPQVIFAKTSKYFESTYGQVLGSADAKQIRDEKFQILSMKTGCSRAE